MFADLQESIHVGSPTIVLPFGDGLYQPLSHGDFGDSLVFDYWVYHILLFISVCSTVMVKTTNARYPNRPFGECGRPPPLLVLYMFGFTTLYNCVSFVSDEITISTDETSSMGLDLLDPLIITHIISWKLSI